MSGGRILWRFVVVAIASTLLLSACPGWVQAPFVGLEEAEVGSSVSAAVSSFTLGTIHYGSAVVADTQTVNFGTGDIFYSIREYGKTGYLYSITDSSPTLYFGDVIFPSPCGPTYPGYQGVDNICEFTSAADHDFSTRRLILIGDKGSGCYQGILLFRQGGLYGGIEPVNVDWDGSLHFNWWYDDSGGSDFSSLCELIDTGFRPKPDGYRFSNSDSRWGKYPNPPANNDFTIDDMRRMFGDDLVCYLSPVPGLCVALPSALEWHEWVNKQMSGGHCDGMAVTSLRFFNGTDDPVWFQGGANATYDLRLANARRNIAYYQVVQFTYPMNAYLHQPKMEQTPSDALAKLTTMMADGDSPVLHIAYESSFWFIFRRWRAHALTPYAVEDKGNRVYWVWIYDNNWQYDSDHPDYSNRYVEINTISNTWSYESNVGDIWSGDADTRTLHAISVSKYSEQPWSWYRHKTFWLIGAGHLLITDSQGRRIGFVGDQFVNEIPGAYESVVIAGPESGSEPIYTVPLTDTYTILLDGQTLTQTETVAIAQFGPGYAVSVDEVTLDPTSQDQLIIAPDGAELVYQSSAGKEITATLALDGGTEGYQLQVRGADVGAGQAVTLTADIDTGKLALDNSQTGGGEYDLEIKRADSTGVQWFLHRDISVSATDTHYVEYGMWDGKEEITLRIDHGSDGTIDETIELKNEIRFIYLPFVAKGR